MMDDKKIKLKWWHLRRIAMSGEYIGGIIAGFGFGVLLMAIATINDLIHYSGLTMCLGSAVSAIGAAIALRAQNDMLQMITSNRNK